MTEYLRNKPRVDTFNSLHAENDGGIFVKEMGSSILNGKKYFQTFVNLFTLVARLSSNVRQDSLKQRISQRNS